MCHHHHTDCIQLTFQNNFYLSCELEHDDGDGVVVIMYASGPCDGCDRVHSRGESKVRKVGRAQSVDTGDYLRNQGQTSLHSEAVS